MANINRDILIPYMDAYRAYLEGQGHRENDRPMSNKQEDYKRGIAAKAAEVLGRESWNRTEIGTGTIGDHAIKAVQRNSNLIGRFQVSAFSDKVKDNPEEAERVLFRLYHDRKDQECFAQLCSIFGRKYDLMAYLYFVLDPARYLPLRSSIFDGIFKKIGIDLQTTGRCSWDNYQEFIRTISEIRDFMREYYQIADVDLLDAHSFLWTLNLSVLKLGSEDVLLQESRDTKETPDVGAAVIHKNYGEGEICKITAEKIYVQFANGLRIFSYPDSFEKAYLRLADVIKTTRGSET